MKRFTHYLSNSRYRVMLLVTVTIGLLILLELMQGTVWQSRMVGLGVGLVSLPMFWKFWRLWKALRFKLMRYEMRVIKAWREFFESSAIVKAFHLLALAFFVLGAAAGVVAGMDGSRPFFLVAGFVLAMAGVCEMTTQAAKLLKKAWAPILGKVLAVSVGVAMAAIAVSRAKQLVHSLAPIDTKYVTEFVALLTAFYSPIVFISAVGVGMAMYASLQLVVLAVLTVGDNVMIQSRAVLGENWMQQRRMFWYRIRKGKRPAGNTPPPPTFLSEFEISLLMSPVSKIILAWMLVHGVEASTTSLPMMAPWLRTALVEVEYRPGSACKNLDKQLRVVYMDDGNVAVARRGQNGYTFDVESCEFYKKAAAPSGEAG